MATANLTTNTAERLAAALDRLAAQRWDDTTATYACIQLDGGFDLRVGTLPETRALAVAVTAVGMSRRIDGDGLRKHAVRMTVSVSCCEVAAIVRHPDGRSEYARRAEGVTVATLRTWASLEPCATCDPNAARERHR